MQFLRFLLPRLVTYVLVVWISVTIVFFVPRFVPGNPVEAVLGRLSSQGTTMDPMLVQSMRETLTQLFGLEGTPTDQYVSSKTKEKRNEGKKKEKKKKEQIEQQANIFLQKKKI